MRRIRDKTKINLIDFIQDRRVVDAFDESVLMSEYDIRKILESVRYAPFEGSQSVAGYKVMLSKEDRESLSHAAYDQYSILTASAVVLVVADVGEFKEGRISTYGSAGQRYRDGAIRDASMSGMLFMMVAKYFGWGSGEIVRFKDGMVRKLFGLTESEVPVMLITIGKESMAYTDYGESDDATCDGDVGPNDVTFM